MNEPISVPTAKIAVNKSIIKIYKNVGVLPTYYLQKGQEFQIEIFNPTTNVILAKISLNGEAISQGGLVVNPGQRVFLDRYLDVAKKFLFDTYEVGNSAEVKKAIVNNGDFSVEFFRETKLRSHQRYMGFLSSRNDNIGFTTTSIGSSSSSSSSSINNYNYNASTTNNASTNIITPLTSNFSKSIETGRVEKGNDSDQKIITVDKEFEYISFHSVEYSMLPISQKINTSEDINIKVYCNNCGSKLGKTDRFCGSCGCKK